MHEVLGLISSTKEGKEGKKGRKELIFFERVKRQAFYKE
jgi:hypothetical protein